MKTLAFGASSSKNSINQTFAEHTAKALFKTDVTILNLNDFPLPMYSIDLENESGFPENAKEFLQEIRSNDCILISLAEHNGSYTAVFKNLFDWMSRIENKMFAEKKLVLLSTAPGARGGMGVMDAALNRFPRHGAKIVSHFSLPKFGENFDQKIGITNEEIAAQYKDFLATTKQALPII